MRARDARGLWVGAFRNSSHRAHRMRALESMRPHTFFTARTGLLDVCARALCKGTFASTVSGVAFGGEGGREFKATGALRRPMRSKGIDTRTISYARLPAVRFGRNPYQGADDESRKRAFSRRFI